MKRNMKGDVPLGTILFIVFLLIFVVLLGTAVYKNYTVERDTTSWLDRAQVASDIEDVQKYLNNTRDGMEKYDLTDGHAALIFSKPDNDFSLIMEALENSIERCELLKGMPTNSTEYIVGLDDLRGQIRELDLHLTYGYWVSQGKLWICGIILFAFLTVVFYFVAKDEW